MKEREFLDRANTIVIKKEKCDLDRAMIINESIQKDLNIPYEGKKASVKKILDEMDRLSPKNKYDHEEVWVATEEYMTGVV